MTSHRIALLWEREEIVTFHNTTGKPFDVKLDRDAKQDILSEELNRVH